MVPISDAGMTTRTNVLMISLDSSIGGAQIRVLCDGPPPEIVLTSRAQTI